MRQNTHTTTVTANRRRLAAWLTLLLAVGLLVGADGTFARAHDGHDGEEEEHGSSSILDPLGDTGAEEIGDALLSDHAEVQTEAEGLQQDLELVAAENGWTVAEARADREVADAFGALRGRLAQEHPQAFAGAALSEEPGGTPTIYIAGALDAEVHRTIEESGLDVHVVDGRIFSWSDLESRAMRVHDALQIIGYTDIYTAFDETADLVEAAVTRVPGLPDSAAALLSRLPASLTDNLVIDLVDEVVGEPFHAYGGAQVWDDGFAECTSGWTVTNGSTTGVTTAAHCDGINQITEDGCCTFSLSHMAQHRGTWGDIEWKTSTHIEPAQFYASPNTLRNTNAVEPRWNITVGESVCAFGRTTNSRQCGADVRRTSISCTYSGIRVDRLVEMDRIVDQPGDSGGGWSWNFTAYGSVVGACYGFENWSVADLYDEALGVSVLTQ